MANAPAYARFLFALTAQKKQPVTRSSKVVTRSWPIYVKRLAIPAISTGVYGYPPEEAVPIIVKSTNDLLDRLASMEEIRFVVSTNMMLELFKKSMAAA